jgi:hypothetical protein
VVLCLADLAAAGQVPSPPGPGDRLSVLDVPFVAQSEALCGGAAAAMVLRYWGRRDVFAEDFAPLVEPGREGIRAGRLAAALDGRGFDAHVAAADSEAVRLHLARGRPPILLLELTPGRRHYVVVVAWAAGRVLLHDPADRPFRVWREAELEAAWARTGRLLLLVVPRAAAQAPAPAPAEPAATADPRDRDTCGGLVPEAVAFAGRGDLDAAGLRLEAARQLCPAASLPRRELAGVRFRQERYAESASLAAEAVALDGGDTLSWRLLATSRYLADDADGALAAWNRIGEPQVDLVSTEGLDRTRPAVVSSRLGVRPRSQLLLSEWRRAARRLADVPALASTRLRYQPVGSGRAEVTAAVVERPLLPPLPILALQLGGDALVRRETRLGLASPGGEGGWLEAGVRWWERRPAAWLSFAAPGALRLPGVVSLEAMYDEQRYRTDASAGSTPSVERRRRASIASSDWLTASLQTRLALAVERDEQRGTAGVAALRLDQRLAADRLSLAGGVVAGVPLGSGRRFLCADARLAVRTGAGERGSRFTAHGRAGFSYAGSGAPLAYWPGAGTGTGRELLLRAHPLLSDGVVTGEAFGRRLLDAGVEGEAWLLRSSFASVGVAAFVDAARPWDRPARPGPAGWLADVGTGLRLRLPTVGVLRLDLATPTGSRQLTFSAGWQLPWPR